MTKAELIKELEMYPDDIEIFHMIIVDESEMLLPATIINGFRDKNMIVIE